MPVIVTSVSEDGFSACRKRMRDGFNPLALASEIVRQPQPLRRELRRRHALSLCQVLVVYHLVNAGRRRLGGRDRRAAVGHVNRADIGVGRAPVARALDSEDGRAIAERLPGRSR
jgi:hypothetical protein